MITSKTITNAISREEAAMNKSISNISSGTISTADNPSESVIASKMEAQIKGTETASKNVQNAVSLLQTADGTLSSVHSMLQRMNELAVSSANGTMTSNDRESANAEFQQLKTGIEKILGESEFNNKSLFASNNSNGSNIFVLQVGANYNQNIKLELGAMDLKSLGLKDLDISTKDGASEALGLLKNSINSVSGKRAYIGAFENRLEHTINNLDNYSENLSNSKSRIKDTEMANEIIKYTKHNLLAQTNTNLLKMYLEAREITARSLLSSFL